MLKLSEMLALFEEEILIDLLSSPELLPLLVLPGLLILFEVLLTSDSLLLIETLALSDALALIEVLVLSDALVEHLKLPAVSAPNLIKQSQLHLLKQS